MPLASLRIIRGDATHPEGTGPRIIGHICNDAGGWGRGFVVAVSARWPQPEREYRRWHFDRVGFQLGAVQLVKVEPDLWVANMIGQRGFRGGDRPPIRYEAVAQCLTILAGYALELGASVHLPRIGCGLAGGRWETIEQLIVSQLVDRGIAVTVYDP